MLPPAIMLALALALVPGCGGDDVDYCITECWYDTGTDAEPEPAPPEPCADDPSLGEPLLCDEDGAGRMCWLGDRLFWSSDALLSWREGDAAATTLLEGGVMKRWFQLDGDGVYWLVSDTEEPPAIHRRSLADDSTSTLELELTGLVNRFAVVDGVVYYPHSEYGGHLHRAPFDGSAAPERISTHTLNRDHALATHERAVYWNGGWDVLRYDIDSAVVTNLAPGLSSSISDFSFSGAHVYWVTRPDEDGPYVVQRAELTGGAGVETIGALQAEYASHPITVNAHGVYWVADSELFRMDLETGESTALASAWFGSQALAASETHVYWWPNGALRRLATP